MKLSQIKFLDLKYFSVEPLRSSSTELDVFHSPAMNQKVVAHLNGELCSTLQWLQVLHLWVCSDGKCVLRPQLKG